jgi:drug/metabolite transporter (DMT)-like permease
MRIALLTSLTMVAFAANSILTRMAIEGGYIDPSGFALVRVAAGALVLGMIISLRGGGLPLLQRNRLPGALSLTIYMIGFSLAYLTLDAGLGALILFGVVQVSMFGHSALRGAAPNKNQIIGASVAFTGLLLALWPGPGGTADPIGAILMVFAGLGWAVYTIVGRQSTDPLAATSANFLLCLPMVLILLVGTGLRFSFLGVGLGILCGGLTSGLGYALWYSVLPRLSGPTAAIVQLSVPIIAIVAGALFLGEALTLLLVLSAALVVGGIAFAIIAQSAPADRS